MVTKTTCLHIPPLYEEGAARIMWESSDGADGYELDVHYDEDFETASIGKTWSDIENAGLSAAEIEALNSTWEQIAKLPAQGLSWRNIEFRSPAWSAIDASTVSWQDVQKLPVEFTEFKGEGEKTQGPDQGLAWANIDSSGLSWSENEALGWNWEDFMFRPSIGINWSQIQSENLSWAETEAIDRTWYEFECQAARGLGWGSLDGRFLDWLEIEAKNITWKQFEDSPPDSNTHIAHTVDIPIYKKKAIFQVRAYKENGESSEYLTSSLINTLPRSLAKYKPPCLHIPELHEGKMTDIVWGDLYGASGYVLERKQGNKGYAGVFDGPGKPVAHPAGCKKPDELYYTPDCKQHLACTDQIPYNEKTVGYRIKAYNTTDGSQYLTSAIMPVIPVFLREDRISWTATAGKRYRLEIEGQGIRIFSPVTMNVEYPAANLQMMDFAVQVPGIFIQTGVNASAQLEILSQQNGKIQFRCTRKILTDKEWSGSVTVMELLALKTGPVTVTLS